MTTESSRRLHGSMLGVVLPLLQLPARARSRCVRTVPAWLDGARPCSRRLLVNCESPSAVTSPSRARPNRGPTCRRYCCAYASRVLGARSQVNRRNQHAHHSPTVISGRLRDNEPGRAAVDPGSSTAATATHLLRALHVRFNNDLEASGSPAWARERGPITASSRALVAEAGQDAAAEEVATFAGGLGADPPTVTRLGRDSRAGRRCPSASAANWSPRWPGYTGASPPSPPNLPDTKPQVS